jgi:hypothetical protein
MGLTIKHATLSNVPDEGVPGEIGPSEWNENHAITGSVATSELTCSTTSDSAAAGALGEYIEAAGTAAIATVTISNSAPAVISDAAHGLSIGAVVNFITTGAFPAGLSVSTNYYVSSQGFGQNSYSVSASVANALAGISINTSDAGSGTHTRMGNGIVTTVTNLDLIGLSLSAGDWVVGGNIRFSPGATTTVNSYQGGVNTTSATLPSTMDVAIVGYNALVLANAGSIVVPQRRISLAAPTTVFLVARANFGTATLNATGKIWARRVR